MTSLKIQAIQTALSGDWKKAIDINKDLIKEAPEDIDALNRLAFAFSILGKMKDAKSTYQKVLKLDSLNSLAIRGLKKLDGKKDSNIKSDSINLSVSNAFIEEQGKTKIIELVNIAPSSVINTLLTGQKLKLTIKRLKIFVVSEDNKYVGVLPDNIGKRLIKFINAGNLYEVFVKSAYEHHMIAFIRETKRASKFRDQPSFLSTSDKSLELDKKLSKSMKASEAEDQDDSEE